MVLSVLGIFEKLGKTSIRFIMSVRPSGWLSVRLEQLGSHWTDFREILLLSIFRVEEIQVLLKSDKYKGYFTRRLIYTFDHIWIT
jgi:hypothetical protein